MGKSRIAPAIYTLAGNIGKGIFACIAGTAAIFSKRYKDEDPVNNQ